VCWNDAVPTHRGVVSTWGVAWLGGQIELQHLAGFYLRTTINQPPATRWAGGPQTLCQQVRVHSNRHPIAGCTGKILFYFENICAAFITEIEKAN